MSQNIVLTTSVLGQVRVRAGWDVPLNELYCNVELVGRELGLDEDVPSCFHEFVYSELPSMIKALSEAGIFLPEGMKRAIEADLRARAGNVISEF